MENLHLSVDPFCNLHILSCGSHFLDREICDLPVMCVSSDFSSFLCSARERMEEKVLSWVTDKEGILVDSSNYNVPLSVRQFFIWNHAD
jgi:hypothetical protein